MSQLITRRSLIRSAMTIITGGVALAATRTFPIRALRPDPEPYVEIMGMRFRMERWWHDGGTLWTAHVDPYVDRQDSMSDILRKAGYDVDGNKVVVTNPTDQTIITRISIQSK